MSYFACPNPTLISYSTKKNQNHTISIGVKSEIEMRSEAIENNNERKEFWDMTVSYKAAANKTLTRVLFIFLQSSHRRRILLLRTFYQPRLFDTHISHIRTTLPHRNYELTDSRCAGVSYFSSPTLTQGSFSPPAHLYILTKRLLYDLSNALA